MRVPTHFAWSHHIFLSFNLKGIVSDSNNIFLWQKLEDIKEKRLFPKFQSIPIICLQVMHDYVQCYCSIDYCVKLILVHENLLKNWLLFHPEMISAHFLWRNVFLREDLLTDVKNSNFKIFESTLYLKSGSMPLSGLYSCQVDQVWFLMMPI